MKAVFLDYGTMGAGLDLTELESLVTDFALFDDSSGDEVADRTAPLAGELEEDVSQGIRVKPRGGSMSSSSKPAGSTIPFFLRRATSSFFLATILSRIIVLRVP